MTQLGSNTSAVDGRDLQRGKTVTMSPDSTLFILKGYYPHQVVFKRKGAPPEESAPEVKKSLDSAKQGRTKGGVKRPATNGVPEEITPAKMQKISKIIEDEELTPEEESKEKSKRKKGSPKLSKTNSDSEKIPGRKVADYFEHSKTSSKDEKEHVLDRKARERSSDGRTSSDKRKIDPSSSGKGDESQSKKARPNNESKIHIKAKRTSRSDSRGKGSKTPLQYLSDEDGDDYTKSVSEKLQLLKQKAKKEHADHTTAASVSSKSTTGSGEKRKSSTDSTAKSKKCRIGKPAPDSVWDLADEKLCIFTGKGVCASEKVRN